MKKNAQFTNVCLHTYWEAFEAVGFVNLKIQSGLLCTIWNVLLLSVQSAIGEALDGFYNLSVGGVIIHHRLAWEAGPLRVNSINGNWACAIDYRLFVGREKGEGEFTVNYALCNFKEVVYLVAKTGFIFSSPANATPKGSQQKLQNIPERATLNFRKPNASFIYTLCYLSGTGNLHCNIPSQFSLS